MFSSSKDHAHPDTVPGHDHSGEDIFCGKCRRLLLRGRDIYRFKDGSVQTNVRGNMWVAPKPYHFRRDHTAKMMALTGGQEVRIHMYFLFCGSCRAQVGIYLPKYKRGYEGRVDLVQYSIKPSARQWHRSMPEPDHYYLWRSV
eukprot:TRINITY_DN7669_c0_g1_i1.p1 TRINITY_DN7669_c0_g1~~TRINITY_DN7669_c0_g1_i1.p1  ORF type:complete len:143 (-),score=8.74 TRINITY_DN7669_c0_g1_i1:12-440(-)